MAEKELRQEFEKWNNTAASIGCSPWKLWQAAYAAGERAMRDKLVQALEDEGLCDCGVAERPDYYKYNTECGHATNCNYYVVIEAINRALPLSAQTEEIKK